MKKLKKVGLLLIAIVTTFALVACSFEPEAISQEEGNHESASIIIKHELDEVSIKKSPKRVIVFDYGILDALDKIGEDIIGLPKSSLPSYLDKFKGEDYVDVGTLKEPNFEKIYELQPDLIIISTRQASLYSEFKKIAPTVYLAINDGDYMNSFKNNMKALGQIFDKEELIEDEVNNIENAIRALNEKAKSIAKNALFVMANDGNLSAYGQDSRFGILYNEFGLTPVDEDIKASTHGQKITFEYIMEKDPDYIFVMDRAAVAGGDVSAKQVMDNDLIKSTKAFKNNDIIYLDAHVWYVSSGGITGTMKMIEEVQSSLQ